MRNYIHKILSGNDRFITLFVVIAGLLLLSGIISPLILERTSGGWPVELARQVKGIESNVLEMINRKQNILLKKSQELKGDVKRILHKDAAEELISRVNSEEYSGLNIAITDTLYTLFAWTSHTAIPVEQFKAMNNKPGEVFFFRSDLITYMSVIDTTTVKDAVYLISCSLPIEKHYSTDIEEFERLSLKREMEEKFLTEFEVDYSPLAARTKDGRKFSIEVLNNINNKIGIITFNKPSLDTRLNSIQENTESLQALLAIAGFLCLSFYLFSDLKYIRSRSLRLLVIFIFLAALRYLFFILDFPARILGGELTSSSYFASSFGFGIVRSPVELFVSVCLLLIFCIILYREILTHLRQSQSTKKSYYIIFPVSIAGIFFLLASYRGLGASIKSVIFDSSLRYFRDPDLIPTLPAGVMQLNILLLGTSVILAGVSLIILLIHYLPYNRNKQQYKAFSLFFILVQCAGFIYDATQTQPQGTAVIRIIFITLILLLSYKIIIEEYRNLYNYLYFTVIASIISVSLLNYYNTKIERESLKTTALEITRPTESLLTFLLNETLVNSLNNQELYSALKNNDMNYDAVSFIIWNRSLLYREKLKSSIALLDKNKNLLGTFGIDMPWQLRINPSMISDKVSDLRVYTNYHPEDMEGSVVSGIIPVKEDKNIIGYITGAILFNRSEYTMNNYPRFLSGTYNSLNATVDFSNLKIFDFVDSTISNIYGEINPSGATVDEIFNADYNDNNEAWINLNINDEDYSTYLLKIREQDSQRIIAVMLKEKNLSWNFYNFLKIFFIHSIFILVLFFILFAVELYRNKRFRFSFRTQLLVAFLLISMLPLIFLALYNRSLTESKNQESTLYKLRKRTVSIRDYINSHSNDIYSNDRQAYERAASDLDINFTLYAGINKLYSSQDEYYNAGLLPEIINPLIYERLELQSYKEFITHEKIDGFSYNSFYTTFVSGENKYIIKVNDVFNRIEYPMSSGEVDVLLFGSYAFAVILIIILSAIFANRISYPIRRLTKATESVAGGDLNFEIQAYQKSEIGDLVKGFNYMIRQLKRSQTELAEMEREIAWKEMARQVAHEIKNPLTPMKLAIQQLVIAYKDKSPKFDVIFDKVSKTVISQIDTLTNIASEFSSFARMPKLKVEEVNLNVVIDDALNLFVEEKTEIIFNKKAENVIIEADKDQLKRTIINLIRNSIQASANKIQITSEICEEKVCIKLIDNGKGIPPELLNKVFEPDFTTKEKGMGLGLKLAKKFVEAVNGSILISESSLKGTCIQIEFPVLKR